MNIPVCPLMSAGSEHEVLCSQDKCAWYIKSYKTCSVYMLGHDALLNVKQKQSLQKGKQG